MSGRLLRAAGVALLLLLLASCGDAPGYDRASVQGFLARSQAGTFAGATIGKARCPADVPLKEGMRVRCTLAVDDARVPYAVTLRHVHAAHVAVRASLAGVVVPASSLQDYVRSTLSKAAQGAVVDCGAHYLVARVGHTFDCTLALGGQQQPIKVTIKDSQGTMAVG